MNVLPLQNDDYWVEPLRKIDDFACKLLEDGNETIVIGCPEFISVSSNNSFPLVMIGAREEAIPYKNMFKGKTIGVCTNLETGRSFIGSVHRTPDVISDMPASPGLIVEDYLIDLRKFLSIPWEIATYKIWLVYYEQLSNGISCRLSTDEKSYGSEEEEKYLNEVILNAPRRTVLVSKAIVYSKEPVAPKSELDIEASVQMVEKKKEHIVMIKGKVPVLPNQKVDSREQVGIFEGVSTVIPLDVVLIRTHGVREQLSFGVPCYKKPQFENGKEIGSFQVAINLAELTIPPLIDGEKIFVYAFSGEFATGPGVVE